MSISELTNKIQDTSSKLDLIIILIISLLSGLAGYIDHIVKSGEKVKKLVLISRCLNAMLAGYVVGSLLSMYNIDQKIIYSITGITGWNGGLIIEKLSIAVIELLPGLLAKIRLSIYLMISPQASHADIFKSYESSTKVVEVPNNKLNIPSTPTVAAPTPIIPQQAPITTPHQTIGDPQVPITTPQQITGSPQDKLAEARAKLGLTQK